MTRVTYYGYFGRTRNVKDAPAALSPALVGDILAMLPPRTERESADIVNIASARGAK